MNSGGDLNPYPRAVKFRTSVDRRAPCNAALAPFGTAQPRRRASADQGLRASRANQIRAIGLTRPFASRRMLACRRRTLDRHAASPRAASGCVWRARSRGRRGRGNRAFFRDCRRLAECVQEAVPLRRRRLHCFPPAAALHQVRNRHIHRRLGLNKMNPFAQVLFLPPSFHRRTRVAVRDARPRRSSWRQDWYWGF
jgi:hypothetical protein